MDVDARVEALEQELERVREKLLRLEEAFGLNVLTPPEWRLTPQEMRLFGALLARPLLTKDAAMAVLYRDHGKDEAEVKIIDVYVCKIRAKVKPFGVAIDTVWGQGYRMSPAAKAEAQRQIDGALALLEPAA